MCYGAAHGLPYTPVRYGLAAEKSFLALVTGPGAANVLPHTFVRHGLAAARLFFGFVTSPGAAKHFDSFYVVAVHEIIVVCNLKIEGGVLHSMILFEGNF